MYVIQLPRSNETDKVVMNDYWLINLESGSLNYSRIISC
jgi:hypothetical protein